MRLRLQRGNRVCLLAGFHPGANIRDADRAAHFVGYGFGISGEQHDRQTHRSQLRDRRSGIRLDRIRDGN